MKNIHILQTDDSTGIFKSNDNLFFSIMNKVRTNREGFHMYITSDEDPKLDEWGINLKNNVVFKCKGFSPTKETKEYHKKIILTTDQYLIKDGVQAINDEFLEWFVKNPSCEEVKVINLYGDFNPIKYEYEIIIPKKEPKQETFEEAAQSYAINQKLNKTSHLMGFMKGAKWQQEKSYSEEDMHKLIDEYQDYLFKTNEPVKTFKEWFEQFKK